MEAERRSTMSSLKGQLSNVEGSVKSMKTAVVVGSVLTVACLAAVFGVTILANEVSKEVKVSNNTLTTKSGAAVMTTSTTASNDVAACVSGVVCNSVSTTVNGKTAILSINALVVEGTTTTIICDDAVVSTDSGEVFVDIAPESILGSTVGEAEVESRNLNRRCGWCKKAYGWGKYVVKQIAGTAFWGSIVDEGKDWFGSDDPAPSGCNRRSLLLMAC